MPKRYKLSVGTTADWQLAAGHYENFVPFPATAYASQTATDTEPYVIYPRPDSETGTTPVARHRWAHGSMAYEIPIYVRGGAFPYLMEIDAENTSTALTGITIGRLHDSAQSYVVNIPQSTINGLSTATDYDVYAKVTDQTGKELKVWWSFQKEATELDHFFFVDNSYTGGTADGKFNTPFKSLDIPGWLHEGDGASAAGKICVFKEGNSQTPSSEYQKVANNASWNIQTTDLPTSFINIPGETPVIDLNQIGAFVGYSGTVKDSLIYGIKAIDAWDCLISSSQNDGRGAFVNGFNAAQERITISHCDFDTVTSWPPLTTTNNGGITFDGTNAGRKHLAIGNINFSNGTGSGILNIGGCIMFMGSQYSIIDKITASSWGTGSGMEYIVHCKKAIKDMQIRRVEATDSVVWINNTYGIKINEDPNTTSYLYENIEVCYCNFDAPDAQNLRMVGLIQSAAAGNGPAFVYRNSGKYTKIFVAFSDYPITLKANDHIDANLITGADNVTTTSDYQTVIGDYQTGSTLLTDAFFTSESMDRGTIGHEIK